MLSRPPSLSLCDEDVRSACCTYPLSAHNTLNVLQHICGTWAVNSGSEERSTTTLASKADAGAKVREPHLTSTDPHTKGITSGLPVIRPGAVDGASELSVNRSRQVRTYRMVRHQCLIRSERANLRTGFTEPNLARRSNLK